MKKKLVIGAAAIGLVAAGIVSAANLDTSAVDGKTVAAGEVTVSGADLTDIEFGLDAEGQTLQTVTVWVAKDGLALAGANVFARIGDDVSPVAVTGQKGKAVIDVVDVPVKGFTDIFVQVSA